MLAALLFIACEAVARVYCVPDGSLRQLVNGYVERLNEERPETWICGNSTMNAGIDAEVMQQRLGRTVIKLTHGTATVRASVDLLEYYLSRASAPPQTLILCTFKDDLNPNGYNATRAGVDVAADDRVITFLVVGFLVGFLVGLLVLGGLVLGLLQRTGAARRRLNQGEQDGQSRQHTQVSSVRVSSWE